MKNNPDDGCDTEGLLGVIVDKFYLSVALKGEFPTQWKRLKKKLRMIEMDENLR